ncbi:helix-turn-helix transcriptional regulator [Furfurilactobacillus milii]|uniref:HTH cro/C1-type domain-containing protein n=1 Tax=Furfurilactobacillus milii TaxID=2888272 RepID=A0A6N9I4W2_9LACO|nr:helix-turn-helix transcriptional regulator [Furfurilactobacillus milii]MYV17734.1 hypothetical protein [Furfurilactobacillus milii]
MGTLGTVIDSYRQENKLSVKALTDGIISYASYYRFVHDNSSISTERFLALIERLNISVDEIKMALDPGYISKYQFISSFIHIVSGDTFDVKNLQALIELVKDRYETTGAEQCLHFLWISQSSMALHKGITIPEFQDIKKHFMNLEQWTNANLFTFALIFPIFTFEELSSSFNTTVQRYRHQLGDREVEEAFFRYLINFALIALSNQSFFFFKKAAKLLAELQSINGSLTVSVYQRFIIDLLRWYNHPESFSTEQFTQLSDTLTTFHQCLFAKQLLNFTFLFKKSVLRGTATTLTDIFIPVI